MIKITPDNASAMTMLGIAYARMGKKEEALKTFGQALELAPEDYEIMTNIGNIHFEKKAYEGAAEQYLKALSIKADGKIR